MNSIMVRFIVEIKLFFLFQCVHLNKFLKDLSACRYLLLLMIFSVELQPTESPTIQKNSWGDFEPMLKFFNIQKSVCLSYLFVR